LYYENSSDLEDPVEGSEDPSTQQFPDNVLKTANHRIRPVYEENF
jgi:hypothetical protein